MSEEFLDKSGLSYFWTKIKLWANAAFATISHTHKSSDIVDMTGYSKPISSSAIDTSDSLNTAIGKLEYKVDSYDDSNYVHKTGDEIIDGVKVFKGVSGSTNYIALRHQNITRGTNPSNNEYSSINFLDSTGASWSDVGAHGRIGLLETCVSSDGSTKISLLSYKNIANDNSNATISVGFDSLGKAFARTSVSTPTVDPNPKDIITRDYLEDVISANPQRACIVGQASDSFTNPWYKVATVACDFNYDDIMITFFVEDTYVNMVRRSGILRLYIRVEGNKTISLTKTNITWLVCDNYDVSDFVLVCPSGIAPTAELWTRIPEPYLHRRFTVISEGSRTTTGVRYTLLSASTVGQSDSITTAGTQKISVLVGRVAYDENGRNIASGYLWRGSYERIEGTSNAHKNLNNYTSTGFYNVKTANVDNCPAGIGIDAVLLVYPWTSSADNAYGTQEITESANSGDVRRWLRRFNNGTWSSWKQLAFLSDCVRISGDEDISGTKSFTGVLRIKSGNYLQLMHSTADYQQTPPSYGWYMGILTVERNAKVISRVQTWINQDKSSGWAIQCKSYNNLNTDTFSAAYALYLNQDASHRIAAVSNVTMFRPDQGNGAITLGTSSNRWGTIYTTTNVNVSSDERLKNSIQKIPDDILDAWNDINWMQFKYNISVEEKGDAARIHSGIIAQQAKEAFKAHGADAARYGFFCWDEWDDEPEIVADDGSIIKEARSAGEAFSVRYGEALCMEAAYQRRENARLKKRIADLEERLAALELKVS